MGKTNSRNKPAPTQQIKYINLSVRVGTMQLVRGDRIGAASKSAIGFGKQHRAASRTPST
ncbi:hypothetical protein [Microcoleus sp. herbarium14]|uniref:hypothetical protein n=1 Tax=Microcoleus sp. herbarium14 TaxID=3055439 RepID=UPI002FD63759